MWSQASAVLPLASKAKAKYSLLMITPQTFIRPNIDATKTRKKVQIKDAFAFDFWRLQNFAYFIILGIRRGA